MLNLTIMENIIVSVKSLPSHDDNHQTKLTRCCIPYNQSILRLVSHIKPYIINKNIHSLSNIQTNIHNQEQQYISPFFLFTFDKSYWDIQYRLNVNKSTGYIDTSSIIKPNLVWECSTGPNTCMRNFPQSSQWWGDMRMRPMKENTNGSPAKMSILMTS